MAHIFNQIYLALSWSLITTETREEITEILWMERRQIEVELLNWIQINLCITTITDRKITLYYLDRKILLDFRV